MGLIRSFVRSIVKEEVAESLDDYDKRISALKVESGDIVVLDGSTSPSDFDMLMDTLRRMGVSNVGVAVADNVRILRFE